MGCCRESLTGAQQGCPPWISKGVILKESLTLNLTRSRTCNKDTNIWKLKRSMVFYLLVFFVEVCKLVHLPKLHATSNQMYFPRCQPGSHLWFEKCQPQHLVKMFPWIHFSRDWLSKNEVCSIFSTITWTELCPLCYLIFLKLDIEQSWWQSFVGWQTHTIKDLRDKMAGWLTSFNVWPSPCRSSSHFSMISGSRLNS